MSRNDRLTRRAIIAAALAAPVAPQILIAAGATPVLHERLEPVRRFVGRWRGQGEGEPGASAVERTYEPALGGRFLMVKNTSTYAPQKQNPKGEVHDDLGFFSFDSARKRLVLRQFHGEGFVNQYVAAAAAFENEALRFESEAIENIGAGWRARETYRFSGADAFEEIFELAEPGKDFVLYSRNRLRRA